MPTESIRPARTIAFAATPPPDEPGAFVEHVLRLTDHREEVRALVAAELATQPTPTPRARRRAQIKALRSWHSAAASRLDDLRSGRISVDAENTANLARRLTSRMSKNHLRLATLEAAERRWHVAVKETRAGIALRRDLRPDPRLHLEHARSLFMLEGNSPRLRESLAEAALRSPASGGLAYWRARYELMAGRYGAALDAVRDARSYPPIRNVVLPLLEPDTASSPWMSWPCNFYTYRYSLATDEALRGMQEALSAVVSDPELVATWTSFGIPASAIALLEERAVAAAKALEALLLWNRANVHMTRSKYASAATNYEACQRAIIAYFSARFGLTIPEPRDESGSIRHRLTRSTRRSTDSRPRSFATTVPRDTSGRSFASDTVRSLSRSCTRTIGDDRMSCRSPTSSRDHCLTTVSRRGNRWVC